MGILKSAADLVYTIRFLKLLVTPIEDTGAFKAGIIDKDGKKNKEFSLNSSDDREAYRTHYTTFHRLVYNLKKIMAKAPGGSSLVARYGAALALIKEHGELKDSRVEQIHEETGIDVLDCLAEESQWFMQEGDELCEGMYRMGYDTMTSSGEDAVKKGDQIRVNNGSPVHEVLGLKIYEGTHIKTTHRVLFSTAEITK
jgi:hypothetical protein